MTKPTDKQGGAMKAVQDAAEQTAANHAGKGAMAPKPPRGDYERFSKNK